VEEVTTLGFPSLSLGGFGFVVNYGSSLAAARRIKRAFSLNSHMRRFVKSRVADKLAASTYYSFIINLLRASNIEHPHSRLALVKVAFRVPWARFGSHDMELIAETLDKFEPAVDITLHTDRLRVCAAANKKKPATKI